MTAKPVHGVYTAILTPRRADDSIDETALVRLIDFLLEREISAFALNGATGELCLTSPQHLQTLLCVVRKAAPQAKLLCGIGAAGMAGVRELAAIAAGEGAHAALLPMPYFFPYGQMDLEAFVQTAAAIVSIPVMLYNLPEFTTGLSAETSCRLIRDVPNVIGIKDSGRVLDTLRQLTREQIPACRIVGNDGALAEALRERVCDGVVSGVACALPELITALFAERENINGERFRQLCELLDAVRSKLAQFPTPWALKWLVEARGVCAASFSQPIAAAREKQARDLVAWYRAWEPNLEALGHPVRQ